MQCEDPPRNAVSGIRDVERENQAVHPLPERTSFRQPYKRGLDLSCGGGSDSINKQFSPLTATYAFEQEVTVVLAAGDTVNYSDSQFLTPVPEPMSVALLGGILLLTGRAIQRRRKQQNNISA